VQGDACREDAYAAALGGERADALVTDPPYCLLTRRRKRGEPSPLEDVSRAHSLPSLLAGRLS